MERRLPDWYGKRPRSPELNLSAITGKWAEAKERRLVPPAAVREFFVDAAPEGLTLKAGP